MCCNYQWIQYQEQQSNECIYFDSGYNCSGKRLEEMVSSLLNSNNEFVINYYKILPDLSPKNASFVSIIEKLASVSADCASEVKIYLSSVVRIKTAYRQ